MVQGGLGDFDARGCSSPFCLSGTAGQFVILFICDQNFDFVKLDRLLRLQ